MCDDVRLLMAMESLGVLFQWNSAISYSGQRSLCVMLKCALYLLKINNDLSISGSARYFCPGERGS